MFVAESPSRPSSQTSAIGRSRALPDERPGELRQWRRVARGRWYDDGLIVCDIEHWLFPSSSLANVAFVWSRIDLDARRLCR
jgi:hypothetical protein